eukprot:355040-Chlamydomonas_euryale.AAC.25
MDATATQQSTCKQPRHRNVSAYADPQNVSAYPDPQNVSAHPAPPALADTRTLPLCVLGAAPLQTRLPSVCLRAAFASNVCVFQPFACCALCDRSRASRAARIACGRASREVGGQIFGVVDICAVFSNYQVLHHGHARMHAPAARTVHAHMHAPAAHA